MPSDDNHPLSDQNLSELAQRVLNVIETIEYTLKNNKSLPRQTRQTLSQIIEQNRLFFVFLDDLVRFPANKSGVDYDTEIQPIINNCVELEEFLSTIDNE